RGGGPGFTTPPGRGHVGRTPRRSGPGGPAPTRSGGAGRCPALAGGRWRVRGPPGLARLVPAPGIRAAGRPERPRAGPPARRAVGRLGPRRPAPDRPRRRPVAGPRPDQHGGDLGT